MGLDDDAVTGSEGRVRARLDDGPGPVAAGDEVLFVLPWVHGVVGFDEQVPRVEAGPFDLDESLRRAWLGDRGCDFHELAGVLVDAVDLVRHSEGSGTRECFFMVNGLIFTNELSEKIYEHVWTDGCIFAIAAVLFL